MKKLFVAVISCMALTCIFTSCSDGGDSSNVSLTPVTNEESSEESSAESSEEESSETEEETEPEIHEYIDGDASAFLGNWECTEYIKDGENVEDVMGMPIYAVFQYKINEDGTVNLADSLIEAMKEYGMEATYSWGLISENEIEIVGSDGTAVTFTVQDDGRLLNHESSGDVYLTKVDGLTDFDFIAFYQELDAQQQQQNDFVMTPVETDADGNIISSGEPIIVEATTTE